MQACTHPSLSTGCTGLHSPESTGCTGLLLPKSMGCAGLHPPKSTSCAGLHPPKSTGYVGLHPNLTYRLCRSASKSCRPAICLIVQPCQTGAALQNRATIQKYLLPGEAMSYSLRDGSGGPTRGPTGRESRVTFCYSKMYEAL